MNKYIYMLELNECSSCCMQANYIDVVSVTYSLGSKMFFTFSSGMTPQQFFRFFKNMNINMNSHPLKYFMG
jgi:hypothetical protein